MLGHTAMAFTLLSLCAGAAVDVDTKLVDAIKSMQANFKAALHSKTKDEANSHYAKMYENIEPHLKSCSGQKEDPVWGWSLEGPTLDECMERAERDMPWMKIVDTTPCLTVSVDIDNPKRITCDTHNTVVGVTKDGTEVPGTKMQTDDIFILEFNENGKADHLECNGVFGALPRMKAMVEEYEKKHESSGSVEVDEKFSEKMAPTFGPGGFFKKHVIAIATISGVIFIGFAAVAAAQKRWSNNRVLLLEQEE
eukprot:TRINITY_DN28363_c0_g1_i1.p1 TRINITY_DN28363_c0_g1~~TRINITY_DN28363_c0_g1_i1.p1  ORF type:complete len:252 (-),score=50.28 TRINITY_DN28363_c0_g1_i1:123-878(-)